MALFFLAMIVRSPSSLNLFFTVKHSELYLECSSIYICLAVCRYHTRTSSSYLGLPSVSSDQKRPILCPVILVAFAKLFDPTVNQYEIHFRSAPYVISWLRCFASYLWSMSCQNPSVAAPSDRCISNLHSVCDFDDRSYSISYTV